MITSSICAGWGKVVHFWCYVTSEIFKQADFQNRDRKNLVSRSFLTLLLGDHLKLFLSSQQPWLVNNNYFVVRQMVLLELKAGLMFTKNHAKVSFLIILFLFFTYHTSHLSFLLYFCRTIKSLHTCSLVRICVFGSFNISG